MNLQKPVNRLLIVELDEYQMSVNHTYQLISREIKPAWFSFRTFEFRMERLLNSKKLPASGNEACVLLQAHEHPPTSGERQVEGMNSPEYAGVSNDRVDG